MEDYLHSIRARPGLSTPRLLAVSTQAVNVPGTEQCCPSLQIASRFLSSRTLTSILIESRRACFESVSQLSPASSARFAPTTSSCTRNAVTRLHVFRSPAEQPALNRCEPSAKCAFRRKRIPVERASSVIVSESSLAATSRQVPSSPDSSVADVWTGSLQWPFNNGEMPEIPEHTLYPSKDNALHWLTLLRRVGF
jgi:hypothetical protein